MLKLTYKLIYYFDYSLFLWNANKGTFPSFIRSSVFSSSFYFLLNRQSLFSIIIFVLYYDYFLAKNLQSRRASRFVLVNFLAFVSQNHIESSTRWGFFSSFFHFVFILNTAALLASNIQYYWNMNYHILAAVDSFFLSEYLKYIVYILRVQCVGFDLMLLFICRF